MFRLTTELMPMQDRDSNFHIQSINSDNESNTFVYTDDDGDNEILHEDPKAN